MSLRPGSPGSSARRAGAHMRGKSPALRLGLLLMLLYLFVVAIDLLGTGISGLGSDVTEGLFEGVVHPLGGLSVGILATVLVQSSSVTTATIVALVGTGVVSLGDAVPMVMGANIGTTITNTMASLGSITRPEEFRRALAGATMHDFFNLAAVAVLLPIEVATGFLADIAIAMSGPLGAAGGGEFNSPIKGAVSAGAGVVEGVVALLGGGIATAVTMIVVALVIIFASLVSVTKTMRVVVAGPAERSLNAVLGRSGVLGILVGVLVTVAVQSSSISTSLLIPMIAAGVLRLENAYPVTLGANIGTTVTALIAALAIPQIAALQIALVHLLFNLAAVLLFYPVPALRRLPLVAARRFAAIAVRRRTAALTYLVIAFVALPLLGTVAFR